MNLFNIQQQYLSLAEQLGEGELTPELEQALQINETELKEKAVNYGFVIRGYEYNNTCIDNEIKRLQELKKRNTNVVNRLENSISEAMKLYGIEKVESPTLKLSFRKSESTEIVNEAQIDALFRKGGGFSRLQKTRHVLDIGLQSEIQHLVDSLFLHPAPFFRAWTRHAKAQPAR